MSTVTHPSTESPPRARRPAAGPRWPAYAAATWALLFFLQSLAAAIVVTSGSSFAADTFGAGIARMSREGDAGFVATLWLAAGAKALVGLLALAPVRPWGRRLPRRAVTPATTVAGALILLYGLVNLAEHVLMKTGATAIPSDLGARALPWHLWLWDPYWIAGGVLLLLAARAAARGRP